MVERGVASSCRPRIRLDRVPAGAPANARGLRPQSLPGFAFPLFGGLTALSTAC